MERMCLLTGFRILIAFCVIYFLRTSLIGCQGLKGAFGWFFHCFRKPGGLWYWVEFKIGKLLKRVVKSTGKKLHNDLWQTFHYFGAFKHIPNSIFSQTILLLSKAGTCESGTFLEIHHYCSLKPKLIEFTVPLKNSSQLGTCSLS